MAEIPSPSKHTITYFGNQMQILIPSQIQWYTLIFLTIWLCGWGLGEVSAIHQIMNDGISIFMMIWITGWTIGGGCAILMILWAITGKEVVEISNNSIIVSKTIFNFGFPKEYSAGYIKDLRVSVANNNIQWRFNNNYNYFMGNSKLAFDYGAKTIRFGNDIDEAEAKQLLNIILHRYPQYKNE